MNRYLEKIAKQYASPLEHSNSALANHMDSSNHRFLEAGAVNTQGGATPFAKAVDKAHTGSVQRGSQVADAAFDRRAGRLAKVEEAAGSKTTQALRFVRKALR